MNPLANLVRKMRRNYRRSKLPRSIELTPTGVVVRWPDGEVSQSFEWADVTEIRTYKADLYIYDMICLWFQTSPDTAIVITEEITGFRDAADEMEERFTSIPEDWYFTVMLPAFESNECILWPEVKNLHVSR